MKTKTALYPLNQNIVVRRIAKPAGDEKIGGIIIPQDAAPATPTEEVEIVALSPDLQLPAGNKPTAKAGDRALIHRSLNGTPVKINGEDLFVIGYVNLIAIVK